jgi:hypothetical protein
MADIAHRSFGAVVCWQGRCGSHTDLRDTADIRFDAGTSQRSGHNYHCLSTDLPLPRPRIIAVHVDANVREVSRWPSDSLPMQLHESSPLHFVTHNGYFHGIHPSDLVKASDGKKKVLE